MTCMVSSTTERHLKGRPLKMYARKIKEQIPIRALACLTIASKLTSHKSQFASKLIPCVPWLKAQPKDICKSEAQILKQLGFKCCKTSTLDYVGLAVSVAGLLHGGNNPFINKIRKMSLEILLAESVHETAVELLDFVCLNRERVYDSLCHSLTCQPPRRSAHYQARFARVLADRMLLAGSVVTAAAVVLGGHKAAAAMVASMCVVLPVTHRDLLTFASCVLECVNLPMPLCNLLRGKEIQTGNQKLPFNHLTKKIQRDIN
ncbi:uncharacterized protein LOC127005095 isoform X2 [Eriocheir sinensis]|nr:uncharacterized protein LOC127005095 isoform X2 [Eriocheir sinensis]